MTVFGLGPAEVAILFIISHILFWPIPLCGGLLGIVCMVQIMRREASRKAPDTKKCPFCAEDIKQDAVVCRYCGRDLGVCEGELAAYESVEGW